MSGAVVWADGAATVVARESFGAVALAGFGGASTATGADGVAVDVGCVGTVNKSRPRRARSERTVGSFKHREAGTFVVCTASTVATAAVCAGSVGAGNSSAGEDGDEHSFVHRHDLYRCKS